MLANFDKTGHTFVDKDIHDAIILGFSIGLFLFLQQLNKHGGLSHRLSHELTLLGDFSKGSVEVKA